MAEHHMAVAKGSERSASPDIVGGVGHVLHVIDRLDRGGAERMLVDLANVAHSDGWQVSVCITRSGGELAFELAPEITLVELGRKHRLDWRAMWTLAAFVRQRKVDFLHVHGRSSFSLLALMKLCGLMSQPLLLHDHFSIGINQFIPIWFKIAVRYLLNQYVGVYQMLRQWAASAGVAQERIHIIGNAINLQRFISRASNTVHPPLSMSVRHPLGITVGGIRAEKGTDTLLHAIANLPRELCFTLLIVGGSADPHYTGKCQNLCSKLGLDDRVVFLGPRSDIAILLESADFAVMPSRSESGPLVLIEYMAFGLPFVSTQVGDVSRKAMQLGMHEFVPPDDPAALAFGLERLLCLSQEERKRRGERGREIARQHFDIRTVTPQWYKLYQAIIAAP